MIARERLTVPKWADYQRYRRDRGAPPWIALQRKLLRNPEWVSLSNADRGLLVVIWMLAADNDGRIEAADVAGYISAVGCMPRPDLSALINAGFVTVSDNVRHGSRDVSDTPRHGSPPLDGPYERGRASRGLDALETKAETETETEVESTATREKISCPPGNPAPIGDRARDVAPAFDPDSAFVWEN